VLRQGHYASPPGIISFKPLGGKAQTSDQEVPWLPPRQFPLWLHGVEYGFKNPKIRALFQWLIPTLQSLIYATDS
jgi:hypothetical protein